LVSGSLSKQEAAGVFLEGLPDKEVSALWHPNMYFPQWTADHPDRCYRKRLKIRNDGSVVVEVGMYVGEDKVDTEVAKK
jgi:hypothetical protein